MNENTTVTGEDLIKGKHILVQREKNYPRQLRLISPLPSAGCTRALLRGGTTKTSNVPSACRHAAGLNEGTARQVGKVHHTNTTLFAMGRPRSWPLRLSARASKAARQLSVARRPGL